MRDTKAGKGSTNLFLFLSLVDIPKRYYSLLLEIKDKNKTKIETGNSKNLMGTALPCSPLPAKGDKGNKSTEVTKEPLFAC